MGKGKVTEKDKGIPVGPISIRIADLGVKAGLGKFGERGLSSEIRKEVNKLFPAHPIGDANWSNYWSGAKEWPESSKIKGVPSVLERVAVYFKVSVLYLLGASPPIPIVADYGADDYFIRYENWLPEHIIGEAMNNRWEESQIKDIYAIRIKDWSLTPAYNMGDIVYVQKNPPLDSFKNNDRVIHYDHQGRARLYRLFIGPEKISLVSPNDISKPPENMIRSELKKCDRVLNVMVAV